jgi:hypothetical protein
MKYVLDSCVALKWALAEPDSDIEIDALTQPTPDRP